MSFILLPTGTLYKKPEKKKLKSFPAGYIGKFYRKLVDNVDKFLGSEFYWRVSNNADIPSEDVQKYILATTDFAKGMQTDINHYLTKDRINNVSKNILRKQNSLELVFEDISRFDAENPIVGSLLKELDKKDISTSIRKIYLVIL